MSNYRLNPYRGGETFVQRERCAPLITGRNERAMLKALAWSIESARDIDDFFFDDDVRLVNGRLDTELSSPVGIEIAESVEGIMATSRRPAPLAVARIEYLGWTVTAGVRRRGGTYYVDDEWSFVDATADERTSPSKVYGVDAMRAHFSDWQLDQIADLLVRDAVERGLFE